MSITVATLGPKNGQCNICGDIGPLTEDHTPPKGCLKPTQVEIRHISSHLFSGPNTSRARRSQNGVKYRTLCARCNNEFLGAKYDPHFIAFVNTTAAHLRTSSYLQHMVRIVGRPQAILRSLLGHISAQGVNRYLKGPLTEAVRDYFLDESQPLPVGIRVFYWAYPHQSHVVFRDAAVLNITGGAEPFTMWLLKFFPIAFMIAWNEHLGLEYFPHSFDLWHNLRFEEEVEIPIVLSPTLPALWPEAPTVRTIIVYGQEAIHAAAYSGSQEFLVPGPHATSRASRQ